MGLTNQSTGSAVNASPLIIKKNSPEDKIIAVAGNPNVGKSTVFNALTGLNQHTGNWPGKTITNAQGRYTYREKDFILVDIPGTYSILANSPEEEVARDFICFGGADATIIVADATCLERNLNLVLQILEITNNVVVCVNLLDEARKKHLQIDLDELSLQLGVPVVGTSARSGEGLEDLMAQTHDISLRLKKTFCKDTAYDDAVEEAIEMLLPTVAKLVDEKISARWVSLKLLDPDEALQRSLSEFLGVDLLENEEIQKIQGQISEKFEENGLTQEALRDKIVSRIVERSEEIFNKCVVAQKENYNDRDRKLDKILTSKLTGIPIMLLLLGVIFWITLTGANYPSELLAKVLFWLQDQLTALFGVLGTPQWVHDVLVLGIYRTVAWVVSVMLPPMAIFFPLFTLLEDFGYLPRIAFNMDKFFKKACAHGKQALTMCMGFGCNACGVIGCRIIDSPRERLIAIITNNFVPCNGRFPTLISIITMFFVGAIAGPFQSVVSTLILTGVIVLGVVTTLLVSRLLSKTLLKGIASSFALELPPYRKPQIGKVIVRSILDRSLFVLGRAVAVAAPAGLIIWVMSNIFVNNISILAYCSNFLDPFARLIGLDGVILMAFILGFPANEIVMPIIIMSYLCTGNILELESLEQLQQLLVANGWTWVTALCTMLFSLMHFPCGTACLTIYKETKSLKWTAISFVLPTLCGILVCFLVASFAKVCGV